MVIGPHNWGLSETSEWQTTLKTKGGSSHHHNNTQRNKPARRNGSVWALCAHYLMLIRPQQALSLARKYCQLYILKYISKI